MELAQKLSRLMEERRLSQADVARAAGMAQNAISRVLNGRQRLYLDQARRIADFLCVDLDYLTDDALDEPRSLNPEALLTDDERAILRLSRLLGPDRALLRLADPSSSPSVIRDLGDVDLSEFTAKRFRDAQQEQAGRKGE